MTCKVQLTVTRCGVFFFAVAVLWPTTLWTFSRAAIGTKIENVEMPTLDGGRHHLLGNAMANVFVFFKPGQEYSDITMKKMALCEKETADKSVHWVGIVSNRIPPAEVESAVKEAGITMPVLIDVDDALYGSLGVKLHPVVGITDQEHNLVNYQHFTKVNFSEVLLARIRHLLKEIDDQKLDKVLHPVVATTGGNGTKARIRLMLAKKFYKTGKYEIALTHLTTCLDDDPKLVAAHTLRGQILAAQGNYSEALEAFQIALELDPDNASAKEEIKACQERIPER